MTDMLAHALAYGRKHLPVFPCRPCSKLPAIAQWQRRASTDEFTLRQMWEPEPACNIGLVTGASGVVALDIDDGGEATLAKLEAEHGPLPASVESITGRGGRHVLLRCPEGVEVLNSVGKLGQGLDIRGHGGFIVVPPSIHPNGRAYRWSVDSADCVADAPHWLLGLIANNADRKSAVPTEEWRAIVAGAGEGSRNDSIARLTGYLLRRGVDAAVAYDLMLSWNATHCQPPLDPKEVERTVGSICQREMRRRGLR